jgi:predicted ABC-type ATPase
MNRRSIVIVAGVNGSGKSTFAASAAGQDALLGQTAINPDDLTIAALSELPSLDPSGANVIGVERAEKAVWKAIAEGESAAIETVLSSLKFRPVVVAARRRRYRTRLIFIGLPSVDIAIDRIRARVASGGHDVPATKVRERWFRAHDNLVIFAGLVDDVLVFSNVGPVPQPVAERSGTKSFRLLDADALPDVTNRLLTLR